MKLLLLILTLFYTHFFCIAQSEKIKKYELIRLKLENRFGWVGDFDTLTNIATVYLGGEMGYIDTTGKQILPLCSCVTTDFYNGIGIFREKNKIRAIDKTGKVVKEFPNLISCSSYEKNVAKVCDIQNGFEKYGIMDKNGDIILPCKYEYIEKISEQYFYVNNNSTGTGIINSKGDTIIPFDYNIEHIDTTSLQFIGYNKEKGYAIFYPNGTIKKYLAKDVNVEEASIEGKYYYQRDSIIIIKEKFIGLENRYGLVNLNFDTIVPLGKYFYLSNTNEGLIKFSEMLTATKEENSSTTINEKGKLATYQYTKCGFLNTKGQIQIPSKFDFAQYFTEELCAVQIDNKWGYINKMGEIIIPLIYDYCLPFKKGFAKVQLKDDFYIIDKSGKIVLKSKSYRD